MNSLYTPPSSGDAPPTEGLLKSVTVNVTAAQIKALADAPITIITVGPDQAYIPLATSIYFTFGTIPYTGDTDLILGGEVSGIAIATIGIGTNADFFQVKPCPTVNPVSPGGYFGGNLTLAVDGANPADGDSTLSITVWYLLASG